MQKTIGRVLSAGLDLTFPGGEAVATRAPEEHHSHEDVYVALRDAFRAARRQLQDRVRVRRGDVKHHES